MSEQAIKDHYQYMQESIQEFDRVVAGYLESICPLKKGDIVHTRVLGTPLTYAGYKYRQADMLTRRYSPVFIDKDGKVFDIGSMPLVYNGRVVGRPLVRKAEYSYDQILIQ